MSSVLWPGISTVAAPNFAELVGELNRRNLSILIGGFVPGKITSHLLSFLCFDSHGPVLIVAIAGGRQQYDASMLVLRAEHVGAAESMGPRYLGMGQSEQDIRYLWSVSPLFFL